VSADDSAAAPAGSASHGVVVVGASLAGVRTAEAIRFAGYTGLITLVGDEPHFPPYDRPPLSKQLLDGSWSLDRAKLTVAADLDAILRLGEPATGLDLTGHSVLVGAVRLPFDGLVIATGATPRTLRVPGADLGGIFILRTVDDLLRLQAALNPGARVVVVGAGFIGCEVAASCRRLGIDVVVVDVFAEPLQRVLGPEVGALVRELHEHNGVRFALGRAVTRFEGDPQVEAVILDDEQAIPADVVLVAVGVRPATDWLEGRGLELDDGVICDSECFAVGRSDVVAVGDVARWMHPTLGLTRVEHWTNAVAQAELAGANLYKRMTGRSNIATYDELSYFWSDQYQWKLQFVGGPGEPVWAEGSPGDDRFVITYQRAGRTVGALCVNAPARLRSCRALVSTSLA
jgi:NADPH-dependent 2,4-dienoyl-CoA reductase/sulfur reductase-like enzyme